MKLELTMRLLSLIFYFDTLYKIVYSQYVATVGGIVALTCNISDWSDDIISLMLWYKGNYGAPFFSLDAREVPLSQAIFSSNDRRLYLNLTSPPSLIISSVRKSDEGEYKCRVDYRNDRTQNILTYLKVVVPPKSILIMNSIGQKLKGLIGPYDEGSKLDLLCQSEGGQPLPRLTWWSGDEQLNGSESKKSEHTVITKLVINKLTRKQLLMDLTCAAMYESHILPQSASVMIDLNLKPLRVQISITDDYLLAGRKSQLECLTFGSRPPAQVTWWKEGKKISTSTESVDDNGNWTLSNLLYIPIFEDDHKQIVCQAENFNLKGIQIRDTLSLDIFYIPQMRVTLGANIKPENIKEGVDVILECNIKANPPILELSWSLNDEPLISNRSQGILFSNHSLVLQRIQRNQRGYYRCHSFNKAGKGKSEPYFLRVQYFPVCKPTQKNVYDLQSTGQIKINCEVDADPEEVHFNWYINSSSTIYEIKNFTQNRTSSMTLYSPRNKFAFSSIYCTSSNTIGRQNEPCIFNVVPANLPERVNDCSIKDISLSSLTVECKSGNTYSSDAMYFIEAYDSKTQRKLFEKSSNLKPSFHLQNLDPNILYYFSIYSKTNSSQSEKVWLKANLSPTISSPNQIKHEITDQDMLHSLISILITVIIFLMIFGVIIAIIYKIKSHRVQTFDTNQGQQTGYEDEFGKIGSTNPDKLTTFEWKECLVNGEVSCMSSNFDYYNLDQSLVKRVELKKDKFMVLPSSDCNELDKDIFQYSCKFSKETPIDHLYNKSQFKTEEERDKLALVTNTFNQLLANQDNLNPEEFSQLDVVSDPNLMKNLKISCDGSEVTISFQLPSAQVNETNSVTNNKTTRV